MQTNNEELRLTIASLIGAALFYAVAAGVLAYSVFVPRGWGGGMGVPGAIVQTLVLLAAFGVVGISAIFAVVFAIVALIQRNVGLGFFTFALSAISLFASLAQLLFGEFGPQI